MGGSQSSAAKPASGSQAATREPVTVSVNPSIGRASASDDIEARAQQIYQKGAEDGIRSKWDELRRTADERVAQEQQRLAQHVQSLMDDFDSKHKRAPQREVQCGQEREDIIACLARENDTLKCADVAAAFEACAGKVITPLMKRGALQQ